MPDRVLTHLWMLVSLLGYILLSSAGTAPLIYHALGLGGFVGGIVCGSLCTWQTAQQARLYTKLSFVVREEALTPGNEASRPTKKEIVRMIHYTFLSKWTVLGLTAIAGGLIYSGLGPLADQRVSLILVGILMYAVGWVIALLDSLQERKFVWTIGLLILSPVLVGPLLYSFFGPRNTR